MPSNAEIHSQLNKLEKDVNGKFDRILEVLNPSIQPTPPTTSASEGVQTLGVSTTIVSENASTVSPAFRVTKPEEVQKPITSSDASAEASNYALNPAYQKIFNEYFDPADGFTGRLEGVYFTIVVPMSFCNADDAWKAFYKIDARLKVLKHDRVEEDMRDWCKAVARNLKYDINVKLKK